MERWERLKQFQSVDRWLSNYRSNTVRSVGASFNLWVEWLKENDPELGAITPDQLVEYQLAHKDYRILDSVQEWVKSKQHLRQAYLRRLYSVVRSFFLYNRAPLPQDVFKPKGETPKVVGLLSMDEIRSIALSSNTIFRAIFLAMFMGGMGKGEIVEWSNTGWESLWTQLERNPDLIRIDFAGRKQRRNVMPYFTLIGGDALGALKIYLAERPQGSGAIFKTRFGDPLSLSSLTNYWRRHCRQLGVIKPLKGGDGSTRYGKNPHEIRDVFRSRWQKSTADPMASEFMMGHEVDPNEYNKAFEDEAYTRRQYRKALPWLNILTEDPETVPRDQVERYEEEVRQLRQEIEEMRPANEHMEALSEIMKYPEARKILLDAVERLKKAAEKA